MLLFAGFEHSSIQGPWLLRGESLLPIDPGWLVPRLPCDRLHCNTER